MTCPQRFGTVGEDPYGHLRVWLMITREQLEQARFPHESRNVRVCETHLSYVVLTGDLAYKVKKAVRLDFVDTTSLATRRKFCEEELRLNRRYAPDLYLRVVPIVDEAGVLRFDGQGEPVEFSVEMRQFDSRDELQSLLGMNAVTATEISALADCMAEAHRNAALIERQALAGTKSFLRKARENFDSLISRAAQIHGASAARELLRWTDSTLGRLTSRLEARERAGFVRECHGDLHSGNVVRWQGELRPFDCIEFDPELRFIDVLSDVAFLVMDLIARKRADLAFLFLNRYLERSGDYGAIELLPSYLVYRALVRTKVELISYEQHPEAADARERAQTYLRTAHEFAFPPHMPMLVIMNGASGSGKSWLSEQLVPRLPAIRIRSDLERKRLAGIDPFASARAPDDIYTLEFNDRTYAHLLTCARECLRARLNVIVDAAFLKEKERHDFANLAISEGAVFRIVSCGADPDTLARRIAARQSARNDPSDADEGVMRRQLETMETCTNDERPYLIEIDTRAPDALARAMSALSKALNSDDEASV